MSVESGWESWVGLWMARDWLELGSFVMPTLSRGYFGKELCTSRK